MSSARENAMWHVIRVREMGDKDEVQSCFMFCTKKWPEKVIFMENTYYERAKGKENYATIWQECLFTVSKCFNKTYFKNRNRFMNTCECMYASS